MYVYRYVFSVIVLSMCFSMYFCSKEKHKCNETRHSHEILSCTPKVVPWGLGTLCKNPLREYEGQIRSIFREMNPDPKPETLNPKP